MTWQAPEPRLVLASASAARAAVLAAAGVVFDVRPAAIDETAIRLAARATGATAAATAMALADAKAGRVAAEDSSALVIGADQILVLDDRWFDKPADVAEARRHLRILRGRAHVLATAVVCRRQGRQVWRHLAMPCLTMRAFSDDFLEVYLAREAGQVTGSVGAYRMEGPGALLFDSIEGDLPAILGLPLLPLLAFLREAGVLRS